MSIWADMMNMQIPLLDKVLRTVLVYAGLAILLRVAGKRDLAQLNSFDLVVMLLLSNVVQNAVIGPDNSLSGGLLGAVVLILLNSGIVRVTNRYPRLIRLFEGSPTTLVTNGRPDNVALRKLGLRRSDVIAACRQQGADDLHEIKEATLTPGGTIEVILTDESRDVTIHELRAEIGQLRTELLQAIAAQGGGAGSGGTAEEAPAG